MKKTYTKFQYSKALFSPSRSTAGEGACASSHPTTPCCLLLLLLPHRLRCKLSHTRLHAQRSRCGDSRCSCAILKCHWEVRFEQLCGAFAESPTFELWLSIEARTQTYIQYSGRPLSAFLISSIARLMSAKTGGTVASDASPASGFCSMLLTSLSLFLSLAVSKRPHPSAGFYGERCVARTTM